MLTSSDFFINIKNKPTPKSKDYKPFFEKELDKIEHGITVGGVYYSGWLYWHLNHWKILLDYQDPRDPTRIKKDLLNPTLRDNEWIIAEHLEKAQHHVNHLGEFRKKGLLIVGSRRFAKTEIAASYIAYNSLVFFGSENMYAASNEPDVNKITNSLKRGYKALDPYFKPIFLEDSWKPGNDVVLGFKGEGSNAERHEYSRLLLRNHNEGRNTQVGAGSTLHSFLLDEIGKSSWKSFFNAVKPAFESEFGWRCSPLATGTTGNMKKAKELEQTYHNMEDNNFISVEIKDESDRLFHFFPGMMSLKYPKIEVPLINFIKKPELTENKDTIKVTQWEKARLQIDEENTTLRNNGQYKDELENKMFFPKDEDDMFLTDDSENAFADVAPHAREHLKFLNATGNLKEDYGWMVRDDKGKAKFIHTKVSVPIQSFPTGPNEDKDAPVIIWEHPIPGQEFGILHVSGSDPYNQDESFFSPSLGTLYIYRRTYDPINGVAQESFVASYSARPQNISKWRDQVRLLLEYYNATCLTENEEPSFIRWFDERNIAHFLEDGLDIARELHPNTKSKRIKGLHANDYNIRYGNGLLKNYCLEDVITGYDINNEPITKKGVTRIKDRWLLTEIASYRPGMNVDRIVGARHALIIAKSKDKFYPVAKFDKHREEKEIKPVIHSPFALNNRMTFKKTRSPFKTK